MLCTSGVCQVSVVSASERWLLCCCKVGVVPVARPPHMYHNGLPTQMHVMPNTVNVYPPTSSASVPRADGVTESWSDASLKLPANSVPPPSADQRPVSHVHVSTVCAGIPCCSRPRASPSCVASTTRGA